MDKKELIEKYEKKYIGGSMSFATAVLLTEIQKDLKELDEPQEVTVPQFVADWVEKCKSEKKRLHEALTYTPSGVNGWISIPKNQETFARAWLDGYEVEKEKRYEVKITASDQYLVNATDENFLGFLQSRLRTKFTKKELEKLGFGWVFECPGVEVEEVEE